jgi:hypothetical protein
MVAVSKTGPFKDKLMKKRISMSALSVISVLISSNPSVAQMRTGWGTQVDGLAAFQGSASLSGGGDFSANRTFLRASSLYNFGNGNFAGLSASVGQFYYEFSQAVNQPWTGIRDIRISAPVRFRVGETASVFLSPQIRLDFQRGASASDGQTAGIFAGIAWQVGENLRIGSHLGLLPAC